MIKKIVILTDQISKIGGITNLIYLKANYWVTEKGYEVSIITTEQKGELPFYTLNSQVRIYDLSVNYNRTKSYFSPKNLLKILKNYFYLQSKLLKIKPDFVIVANHIPVTFFFPLLFTKGKFIKEFHFSKFFISKAKKTFFAKFEYWLETIFDFLVVLSPEERTFYHSNNVVTISNPIQLDNTVEPVYINRKNIALAAGRISEVKRFDVLIDIWSEYIKKKQDWKLEIYGEGEEEYVAGLKEKIVSLNLSEYVEIKASINTIKNKMQEYGLYVMTSSMECFPMVLLEAQSCGLPIISYDCPTGPRNILTDNKNGVLIEMDNQEEFVEMLIELTTNDTKRIELAIKGYENSKNYTIQNVMDIWDKEIINNLDYD